MKPWLKTYIALALKKCYSIVFCLEYLVRLELSQGSPLPELCVGLVCVLGKFQLSHIVFEWNPWLQKPTALCLLACHLGHLQALLLVAVSGLPCHQTWCLVFSICMELIQVLVDRVSFADTALSVGGKCKQLSGMSQGAHSRDSWIHSQLHHSNFLTSNLLIYWTTITTQQPVLKHAQYERNSLAYKATSFLDWMYLLWYPVALRDQ